MAGLRYRFTTDAWQTTQEAPAELVRDERGARVQFAIPVSRSDVGQLEGLFTSTVGSESWIKDGASNFRGYAFAVPDQRELQELLGR